MLGCGRQLCQPGLLPGNLLGRQLYSAQPNRVLHCLHHLPARCWATPSSQGTLWAHLDRQFIAILQSCQACRPRAKLLQLACRSRKSHGLGGQHNLPCSRRWLLGTPSAHLRGRFWRA